MESQARVADVQPRPLQHVLGHGAHVLHGERKEFVCRTVAVVHMCMRDDEPVCLSGGTNILNHVHSGIGIQHALRRRRRRMIGEGRGGRGGQATEHASRHCASGSSSSSSGNCSRFGEGGGSSRGISCSSSRRGQEASYCWR
jgi:hypothetical protein